MTKLGHTVRIINKQGCGLTKKGRVNAVFVVRTQFTSYHCL